MAFSSMHYLLIYITPWSESGDLKTSGHRGIGASKGKTKISTAQDAIRYDVAATKTQTKDLRNAEEQRKQRTERETRKSELEEQKPNLTTRKSREARESKPLTSSTRIGASKGKTKISTAQNAGGEGPAFAVAFPITRSPDLPIF